MFAGTFLLLELDDQFNFINTSDRATFLLFKYLNSDFLSLEVVVFFTSFRGDILLWFWVNGFVLVRLAHEPLLWFAIFESDGPIFFDLIDLADCRELLFVFQELDELFENSVSVVISYQIVISRFRGFKDSSQVNTFLIFILRTSILRPRFLEDFVARAHEFMDLVRSRNLALHPRMTN
jgi:hypothetical protein